MKVAATRLADGSYKATFTVRTGAAGAGERQGLGDGHRGRRQRHHDRDRRSARGEGRLVHLPHVNARARSHRRHRRVGAGAWVVLPTYNERENLAAIAAAILEALPGATLLVVDDSSPDGTGDIAEELAAADARIRVRHRPAKQGLGRAYLDGFGVALTGGAQHRDPDGRRLVA